VLTTQKLALITTQPAQKLVLLAKAAKLAAKLVLLVKAEKLAAKPVLLVKAEKLAAKLALRASLDLQALRVTKTPLLFQRALQRASLLQAHASQRLPFLRIRLQRMQLDAPQWVLTTGQG